MKRVLVIGSGGREHALAWALSRSPQVGQVYATPGNGGTDWPQQDGKGLRPKAPSHSAPLAPLDFEGLLRFAQEHSVDLTVVGPEAPLAEGIVDHFEQGGLRIFGPSRFAAQLEASKAFCKDFMHEYGIPTAEYAVFDDYQAARQYLAEYVKPVVVKADGLAAGKGVIVCSSPEEAEQALYKIMVQQVFGPAGERVVIEERLAGREISVLGFSDGRVVKAMLPARDYKRALDGDRGGNTGGMGAFAPVDDVSSSLVEEIVRTVLQPAVDGMNALGSPYKGVLYAGLMLTEHGPRTLEFNCRLGDPETQVLLPLLQTDLLDILEACVDERLAECSIQWRDTTCATVVLAAPGYPEDYPKSLPVAGIEAALADEDVVVFHAGTASHDGILLTNGGRVLAVTGQGNDLQQALERVYRAAGKIDFEGMHFRRDIGRTYTGGGA